MDPSSMDTVMIKRKYAKICAKYAKICKIRSHEIYMQNTSTMMQKFALPTLLMVLAAADSNNERLDRSGPARRRPGPVKYGDRGLVTQ